MYYQTLRVQSLEMRLFPTLTYLQHKEEHNCISITQAIYATQ